MSRTKSVLSSICTVLSMGCFSAPQITGTTQEVVATFTVVDADPDDGRDTEYEVGDSLPEYSLQTELLESGLSGTLVVHCTLTQQVQPSPITSDDTGPDGVVAAGETVTRTFSLTQGDSVWDCGDGETTTSGEQTERILEIIAGESGVIPVTIWVGDSLAGSASLTHEAL